MKAAVNGRCTQARPGPGPCPQRGPRLARLGLFPVINPARPPTYLASLPRFPAATRAARHGTPRHATPRRWQCSCSSSRRARPRAVQRWTGGRCGGQSWDQTVPLYGTAQREAGHGAGDTPPALDDTSPEQQKNPPAVSVRSGAGWARGPVWRGGRTRLAVRGTRSARGCLFQFNGPPCRCSKSLYSRA